ncbi:hypothetical protein KJ652_03315 [Patescibacteria group bacterium]|nr:hypothetical protein [Patescibacteria group bacterium]MBU1123597.1 hypothetical protein [Patescibacteria group bacterium]
MEQTEQARVFVIDDDQLNDILEQGDVPFEHITDYDRWREVMPYSLDVVVNTNGKNASRGINPIVCIDDYHEFVRRVFESNEPPYPLQKGEIWQPSAIHDVDTEIPDRTDKRLIRMLRGFRKRNRQIINARRNRVSHIVGPEKLNQAVSHTLTKKTEEAEKAVKEGLTIRYSGKCDRYLEHHIFSVEK